MTRRSREIYLFVESFIAEHGYSPTVREIGAGVGLRSPATVDSHLRQLQREGRVDWLPEKPRTIRVKELQAA